jgi:hypothetical protein
VLCILMYYWYDVINANKMIHNELVLLVCFSTVDDMNLLIWSNPIHYIGSVLLCAPGCCRKLGYHSCPNDHATLSNLVVQTSRRYWYIWITVFSPISTCFTVVLTLVYIYFYLYDYTKAKITIFFSKVLA